MFRHHPTTRLSIATMLVLSAVILGTIPVVAVSDGSTVDDDRPPIPTEQQQTPPTADGAVADRGGVDLPIVLLAGHGRLDERAPLDNDVRTAIYETVRRLPASPLATVADRVDVSESTVRHHARVLDDAGLVTGTKLWGNHRLVPASMSDQEITLAAALRDDPSSSLLTELAAAEPTTLSELAERADRAPSTVSHHVDRLEAAELIERQRTGQSVELRLADRPRAILGADD